MIGTYSETDMWPRPGTDRGCSRTPVWKHALPMWGWVIHVWRHKSRKDWDAGSAPGQHSEALSQHWAVGFLKLLIRQEGGWLWGPRCVTLQWDLCPLNYSLANMTLWGVEQPVHISIWARDWELGRGGAGTPGEGTAPIPHSLIYHWHPFLFQLHTHSRMGQSSINFPHFKRNSH